MNKTFTTETIKIAAKWLNFTEEEMTAIIPYLLKHRPELETADDICKYWEDHWFRNRDFDKDIVDYEFQYIGEYASGEIVEPPITTKEELKQYILDNHVFKLDNESGYWDANEVAGWCIYKINDNLWIEKP